MARRQYRTGSAFKNESDACRLAPFYRYRVAMRSTGAAAEIVWATNDVEYARLIAAQLNAGAQDERAWVEAWNLLDGRGRWARAR
jgi:hypothetical protein